MGLRASIWKGNIGGSKFRLEDVASGYWTMLAKHSSGLVSHYGSTPSSSARPSTLVTGIGVAWRCYNDCVWQAAYRLAIS